MFRWKLLSLDYRAVYLLAIIIELLVDATCGVHGAKKGLRKTQRLETELLLQCTEESMNLLMDVRLAI